MRLACVVPSACRIVPLCKPSLQSNKESLMGERKESKSESESERAIASERNEVEGKRETSERQQGERDREPTVCCPHRTASATRSSTSSSPSCPLPADLLLAQSVPSTAFPVLLGTV
jgi:hypothetical protein